MDTTLYLLLSEGPVTKDREGKRRLKDGENISRSLSVRLRARESQLELRSTHGYATDTPGKPGVENFGIYFRADREFARHESTDMEKTVV